MIYLLFLASGVSGLIYEVVWARQLALFLGSTTYAHTAIVSAYMIGLAAGGIYFGRVADRRDDMLRLYAGLESGIGLYAAATLLLFGPLQTVYSEIANTLGITGASSHVLRFSLALIAVLVATFLMGGTLPVLVRGLARQLPNLTMETARLYGINTLGATLGAFATGFILLPAIGVRGSIAVGVTINLLVALVAAVLYRRATRQPAILPSAHRPPVPHSCAENSLSNATARVVLIGFALSGLAALVYQFAWIRALTLVFGSSVYAFSTTLTTFLIGIAAGSLLYSRFLAENNRPMSVSQRMGQAAVMQLIVGLSAVIGLPLIGEMPGLLLRGVEEGISESFVMLHFYIFALSFALMIVPTLLLGALFPLLTGLWTRDTQAVGLGVGSAYAANTVGTVLGALLGGLLLTPLLGIRNAIVVASGLHIAVAVLFWLLRTERPSRARYAFMPLAMTALFAGVLWAIPPWDKAVMTLGVFDNFKDLVERTSGRSLHDIAHSVSLLYYKEGIDATVAVLEVPEQRLLVINGKVDASSRTDLRTQVLLGQLPVLIHPDPRRVLVVGLGSGITAASVATHNDVEHIDLLEISREVVAASAWFAPENQDVLSDPRVTLNVIDARNFLISSKRTYDVIISEPSNPWISGVSNLFTQEYFEQARAHLNPGGVICQWFHIYGMATDDLKTVFETFQSAFPHVSVWLPQGGDLILIGSESSHAFSFERLHYALESREVRENLKLGGIGSITDLIHSYLIGGTELASYTVGAALNTDDRPRIEFNAPRNLYSDTALANLVDILSHLSSTPQVAPVIAANAYDGAGLSMGLVLRKPETTPEQWRFEWLLERRTAKDEIQSIGYGVDLTSRRILQWQTDRWQSRIEALALPGEKSMSGVQDRARQSIGGDYVERGQFRLRNGDQGLWAMSIPKPEWMELNLAWTCAADHGGINLYSRRWRMPDPGDREQRVALLAQVANSFRCVRLVSEPVSER